MAKSKQARLTIREVCFHGAKDLEELNESHVRLLKDPTASETAKAAARAMIRANRRQLEQLRVAKNTWGYRL